MSANSYSFWRVLIRSDSVSKIPPVQSFSTKEPESGKDYDIKVLTMLWKPNHKPLANPLNTLEEPEIQVCIGSYCIDKTVPPINQIPLIC